MLILLVRYALQGNGGRQSGNIESGNNPQPSETSRGVLAPARHGIIGNIAFYLLIIVVFAVLKGMGILDSWLRAALEAISK